VISRTIEVANGRISVVAGTGSNSTEETLHQTKEAESLGADACLLVTPYYNRPTQEGLYAHFKKVAETTSVPLVLYNVPGRTGCDLLPETIGRLSSIEGIVGIKEASGKIERVSEIRSVSASDFFILSGEDALTLEMMNNGAVGTISVTANVLPKAMAEFCDSFLSGNIKRASAIDEVLQSVHEILFIESNPTPAKWALHQMGIIHEGIRMPLLPLSSRYRSELKKRIDEAMEALK
jgi:4-hydroxy-tetrahydrodipicolinate synthase